MATKKAKSSSKVSKKAVSKVEKKKTPKATKTKVSKAVSAPELTDFDDLIDDIEKSTGLLSGSTVNGKRVSTTLSALDLILGSGLTSGWYTFAGQEQSSKTTLATTVLTSLATGDYAKKIPIKMFFDYEGSFSADYFLSQAKNVGFKGKITDIFGIVDPQTEKYLTKPIIRKYSESVGEKFFDTLAKIERRLPDKRYQNDKWWLVYENDKKITNYKEIKEKADAKKFKRTGKLWVETDNPYPQAVLVVDSYPAMEPENQDVDDPKAGLASQARMFAEQLRRVKGRMASKKIIVMGINIYREVPMAMFGPTEKEACGTALKQFSDVRLKMTSRSSAFGNKGKIEKEASVTGGKRRDYYRYVNIKTIKNKLSVPDLETWVRIWVRDGTGEARGYDPVFDSFYFLTLIGATSHSGKFNAAKSKFYLYLDKIGVKDWPKKPKQVSWMDFKRLILCDKKEQEKIYKALGYKGKHFSLRSKIKKMGNDPKSFDLFVEAEANTANDDD